MLRGLLAVFAVAPALLAAPSPTPQERQSESEVKTLQRKFDAKLKKSFVSFGGWETDFDMARARARKEDKVLFVYFSRSYAP